MRALIGMGLVQGVLPPHERPHIPSLRKMGFTGSDAEVLSAASTASPMLLANVSSASAMWAANAATVSPSADTADKRVHFTPANLSSHLHRSIEAETTTRVLKAIFADEKHFKVHDPVPFAVFGDEGAANQCRITRRHGSRGYELFVHGRSALVKDPAGAFARQAVEASHIVATTHGVGWGNFILAQQSRKAIEAGAFHNDVVAVANENVLLCHEEAFENRAVLLEQLVRRCEASGFKLHVLEARSDELSLPEAVKSYLFNSQIVTLPHSGEGGGGMALILPHEVEETPNAKAYVDRVLASNGPIRQAHYFDLRQSMRNGGGPACLRLRVVLTDEERAALSASVILDEARIVALEAIVRRHYRDRLTAADLADPALLTESRTALDEIGQTLNLGPIHEFQKA
jgi:succinylarginine dihydrolase